MSSSFLHAAVLLTAAILSGCASAVLLPAPNARTVVGASTTLFDEVDGVRVTVQADAWQGARSVLGHVQPMRVTIDNHSRSTIRVRYGDFALVSTNGRRYAALPPFRVEGELLSPMLSVGFSPFSAPGFAYRRFYVAPYFAPLYPGIPVYRRSYVFFDPGYYAIWHADFARSIRPSVEVLALALPEGVLEPDGQVSGFLYFRTLDPDAGAAVFRASIVAVHDGVAAVGGTVLGELSLPFVVDKRR